MVDPAKDEAGSDGPDPDPDHGPLAVIDLFVAGSRVPVRALPATGGWFVLAGTPTARFPYELLRRGKVRYLHDATPRWSRVALVDAPETRAKIVAEFQRRSGSREFGRWFPAPGRLLRLSPPTDEEPAVDDPYGDWVRGEFDAGTVGYAERIRANPVEVVERRRTTDSLRRAFPGPSRLLELGSGPGPETVDLLGEGHTVTAVDISPRMLAALRRRAEAAGVDTRLRTETLRIAAIGDVGGGPFDGAYSTFGALNCEPQIGRLAAGLATQLRPGARFVAGVFNSLAAPELLGGLLSGRWRRASARFHRPVPAERSRFGLDWYSYRTATFFAPFRADFDLERVESVGLVLPPPDAVDRWPRFAALVPALERWDARLGRAPGLRALGDQLVLFLRRRGVPR